MKHILIALVITTGVLSCKDGKNGNKAASSVGVKTISSPAPDSCAEPFLFTDKNDLVYLSWIEKKGKHSTLYFSTLSNQEWSKPQQIASGNNWFVNWADYPVISSDGSSNLMAHFLEKSDTGKFTYDIKIVSSADSGKTWSQSKILNEDNVKAEHGFVSIMPYKDGFFAAWLDGRKAASEFGAAGHGHHGEMTLRGALLGFNGTKINEWELDDRICDCCQTSVAITNNGPVVLYRDRSEN